ncbi:hypothetical protein F4809DRAFT_637096 [Biscogniauxia mediterranea]|nr:hypothetical protein F4809DRAFT_637096 [Biscogniauxia mediterranea]
MANDAPDLKNANYMAESYCACAIANFEGLRRIDFPTGSRLRVTLEELDGRVRRLESIDGIARPPPMQEPSWDTLTWRISRLPRSVPEMPVPSRVPSYIRTSLPLLKSTAEGMPAPVPMAWPDESRVGERELLGLVVQWLCYVAGRRSFRANSIPFEVGAVCSLALDLSLSFESRPGHPLNRSPLPMPGPIPTGPGVPGRSCFGPCACSYEKTRLRDDLRSVLDEYHRDFFRRRGARRRVAGWFKKLAFWRRKRVDDDDDDDASTISRLSSETLAA